MQFQNYCPLICEIYIYIYIYIYIKLKKFMVLTHSLGELGGLVSLFNGISTFVGYLMPKLFSLKNSSCTI